MPDFTPHAPGKTPGGHSSCLPCGPFKASSHASRFTHLIIAQEIHVQKKLGKYKEGRKITASPSTPHRHGVTRRCRSRGASVHASIGALVGTILHEWDRGPGWLQTQHCSRNKNCAQTCLSIKTHLQHRFSWPYDAPLCGKLLIQSASPQSG